MQQFVPYPGAVIAHSVTLVPGVYDFTGREGLVIAADGIEVLGAGVVLRGGATSPEPGAAAAERFLGTGILMEGRSGVVLRGLSLTGFDVGIRLTGCAGVRVEDCDLSGCFHDPDWGWDDHGDHGGFLVTASHDCVIKNCRANQVWDALHLRFSDNNLVENNDFSHTSNTGLKMWRSCGNRVYNNNLSWGIRISPGEVHARDSSCVLLESGSNGNVFKDNDMSHGGDGFFIRVLNGFMSTGNLLEGNDCSFANNNGIEAWADHNAYVRNTVNHSSYGFWLGNSDHTLLQENEVAYNGTKQHNAPEAFGNAGITFANGSCSHSLIIGNRVHDNAGPGIAIRHTAVQPSLHVLIAGNDITGNRDSGRYKGHGIYLKHARQVLLKGNRFSGNMGQEVFLDGGTGGVYQAPGEWDSGAPEPLRIRPEPGYPRAGSPMGFVLDGPPEGIVYWDFGDGASFCGATVRHTYPSHGLYPLCATAFHAGGIRLGGMGVQVLPAGFAALDASLSSYAGSVLPVEGLYGLPVPSIAWTGEGERVVRLDLKQAQAPGSHLVMQLRFEGDLEPDWEKKRLFPVVTLLGSGGSLRIAPETPLLSMEHAPDPSQRGDGRLLLYPLAPKAGFVHTLAGDGLAGGVHAVLLDCGSSGARASSLLINAIGWADMHQDARAPLDLVAGNRKDLVPLEELGTGAAFQQKTPEALLRLDPGAFSGAAGVRFRSPIPADRVLAVLEEAILPQGPLMPEQARYRLESISQGAWRPLGPETCADNNMLSFPFPAVMSEGFRVRGIAPGRFPGLRAFSVFLDAAARDVRVTAATRPLRVDWVSVKLNKEPDTGGQALPDLTLAVYAMREGVPDQALAQARVPADAITPYQPLQVALPGLSLKEGEAYALVLGQAELAASRKQGGYYRWVCGGVAGSPGIATLTQDGPTPAEHTWGTAWLKVSCEGAQAALTHSSDHVGVRLGLADVPRRYQVFHAPYRASVLTDGQYVGPAFLARDEEIRVEAGCPLAGLYLFLEGAKPEGLTVLDGQGLPLSEPELREGLNWLPLRADLGEVATLSLRVRGEARFTQLTPVCRNL